MKILARNLARTTTEAELRALFEAFGKVQYCTLAVDKETGASKGFAFIEMPRPGDAKAAVKSLNGKNVAGNKIRVKKADQSKPAKPAAATVEKTVAKEAENKHAENAAPVLIEAGNESQGEDTREKSTPVNPGIWSK